MAATELSPSVGDHIVKVLLDDEANDKETSSGKAEMTTMMKMTKGDYADDGVEVEEEEEEEAMQVKEKGESGCDKEGERQSWNKKREYLLTLMGYIVGIGNIWRFPYLCNRNGGGAFLLPFVLCLVLMGLPLLLLETALGQFTGRSPLHVWSVCPLVKGIGLAMGITCLLAVWKNNVLMSWALYYTASSFKSTVPWSLCGQWWNTPQCVDLRHTVNRTSANVTSNRNVTSYWNVTSAVGNDTFVSAAGVAAESSNGTGPKPMTAGEEFWQHNVLQVSSGFHELGHVVWYLAVCQCVVTLLVFLILMKGIKASGKVVYVTVTAPYILLTILLVRGVTLPGSVDGILFYITPDFERLLDPTVWIEAALQVFYSLGPGFGGLIAIASYNKFNNNCLKDALLLCFMSEGTSVFGGFAIFSLLGYMAHQTGVPVSKVVSSGPGLVFIVYPEAISMLPLPQLWAVLFFLMLITVVIDSQLAAVETVLTIVCDSFPRTLGRHRVLVTGSFSLIILLLSMILVSQGGVYVLQLLDWFMSTLTTTTVVLLECVILSWVYGADRFGEDIQMMMGRRPPMIINILWCFVNPLLLAVLLIATLVKYQPPTYGDYHYDIFGTLFGWSIALVSFVPIPGMAIYQLLKAKGSLLRRLKQTTTPDEHWGPADPTRRLVYRKKMRQRAPRRHFLDVLR